MYDDEDLEVAAQGDERGLSPLVQKAMQRIEDKKHIGKVLSVQKARFPKTDWTMKFETDDLGACFLRCCGQLVSF